METGIGKNDSTNNKKYNDAYTVLNNFSNNIRILNIYYYSFLVQLHKILSTKDLTILSLE